MADIGLPKSANSMMEAVSETETRVVETILHGSTTVTNTSVSEVSDHYKFVRMYLRTKAS